MLKLNTQFIPARKDDNIWKITTIVSVIIYAFIVLLGYSLFNYFLISGLVIVQLYFIISNSKESYEFKSSQLITRIYFIRKQ